MRINTPTQALEFIKSAGSAGDADLNLFLTALAFSKIFNPDSEMSPCLILMEDMKDALSALYTKTIEDEGAETVYIKHGCLVKIIHEQFGFDGDENDYGDADNADMFHVIKHKKGLPVALSVLYIHLAREMEWQAYGINFPGHFLMALEHEGDKIFIDPFRGGQEVHAGEMRQILKAIAGQEAELSHDYYNRLDDKNVIIRLQNNLKSAYIESEKYEDALKVTEALRLFVPNEHRLLFDSAILKVKAGQFQSAREDALEYVQKATNPKERVSGEQLLYEIERALN